MKPIIRKTSILAASMMLAMSGAAMAGGAMNKSTSAASDAGVSGSASGSGAGVGGSAGAQGSAGVGTTTMERDNPSAAAQGGAGLESGAKVGTEGSNLSGSVGGDADADVDVGAAQGESGLDSDVQAGSDVNTSSDLGADAEGSDVLATIEQSSQNAAEIRDMTSVSNLETVEIGTAAGDAESRNIENAVSMNETEINELRTAIEENAQLSAELETRGIQANDVLAADVQEDGMVKIFHRRS